MKNRQLTGHPHPMSDKVFAGSAQAMQCHRRRAVGARGRSRARSVRNVSASTNASNRSSNLLQSGILTTNEIRDLDRETVLDRGAESDVVEAEAAIERLAEATIERLAAPTDDDLAVREIWLLRLRALLARAQDDTEAYAHFRDRYRDTAKSLGFEGHINWAEAMP